MELTIKDRLYIQAFLPKECTFKQFNLKKDIIGKVEISAQERETVGLKENSETKSIEWDVNKDTPLSVDFSEDELLFLKGACEKLSDEVLPDDMWNTIEKIYDAAVQQ